MTKLTKSRVAIELSKLKGFEKPKVRAEQYLTEPEIAAEVLWNAFMMGDIGSIRKVSADLGCGTGILGLGALMLGCQKAYFVENDKDAIKTAKKNYEKLKSEGLIKGKAVFLCKDIADFDDKADVIMQNPPFGTKEKHADRVFLEKAFETADIIYSFHKTLTRKFVENEARKHGFVATHEFKFEFPLKQTMEFHRKKMYMIEVSCFRLEKKPE